MFLSLTTTNYIVIGLIALVAAFLVWWIFRKDDEIYNSYNDSDDWSPDQTKLSLEKELKKVYIDSGYSFEKLGYHIDNYLSYDNYHLLDGDDPYRKAGILINKWKDLPKVTGNNQPSSLQFTDPFTLGVLAEMTTQNDFVESENVGAEDTYTGQGNGGEFAGGGSDGKWDKIVSEADDLDKGLVEQIPNKAGFGELGGKFIPAEPSNLHQDEANNIGIHDTFKQLEAIQGDTPVMFGGIGDSHITYAPASDSSYTDHSHYFGSSDSSDSWSDSGSLDSSSSND